MNTYYPDCWVPILLETPEYGKIYKVFAGWYGGFAGSDTWKLSSGVTKISKDGDRYVLTQNSGSVYNVPANTHMSLWMESLFNAWKEQLDKESDVRDVRLYVIGLNTLLEAFNVEKEKE